MADAAQGPKRTMMYPYTFSAKLAQYPYKKMWKHSVVFRYWVYGIIAAAPVFYKIQKLSRSPENIAKWDAIRRKQFSGEPHHH